MLESYKQVAVYCRGASILLVGTHKDRVPDPRDHERISVLLTEQLQATLSWVRVAPFLQGEVPTGRGVLCFFPVDNKLGIRDPVVGQLMQQVDLTVRGSEHISRKVPFAWLALLDIVENMKKKNNIVVPYSQILRVCADLGMPSGLEVGLEVEVTMALRFFDKLGLLMYHEALPHLVILLPAEFLIPHFTRIVCDFRMHAGLVKEHQRAKMRFPVDYQTMQTKGVVSARLLDAIWTECSYKEDVQQLMVSLGLMVPILSNEVESRSDGNSAMEFLVPAILPDTPMKEPVIGDQIALTARVVFSQKEVVNRWRRLGFLTMDEIKAEAQVRIMCVHEPPLRLISLRLLAKFSNTFPYITEFQSIHRSLSQRGCRYLQESSRGWWERWHHCASGQILTLAYFVCICGATLLNFLLEMVCSRLQITAHILRCKSFVVPATQWQKCWLGSFRKFWSFTYKALTFYFSSHQTVVTTKLDMQTIPACL